MSAIDEQSHPRLAAGVRLQKDAVSGEPVLLFPEGVMFLNPTAYEIVTRCDGRATVVAILSALAVEYEADPHELRRDVLDCLAELRQKKLIAFSM